MHSQTICKDCFLRKIDNCREIMLRYKYHNGCLGFCDVCDAGCTLCKLCEMFNYNCVECGKAERRVCNGSAFD